MGNRARSGSPRRLQNLSVSLLCDGRLRLLQQPPGL